MESKKGNYAEQDEISKKIWNAEHFGRAGTIALAFRNYELSLKKSELERSLATLEYACALYSAIGNCFAQLKKFHLVYFFIGIYYLLELDTVVFEIIDDKMHKNFNASQKEALMAYMLMCRFTSPFSGYRKMVIKLGKEIISSFNPTGLLSELNEIIDPTFYLVCGRLSRLCSHPASALYESLVSRAIHYEEIRKYLDWRTVNRLARLIGDKKMVQKSALLADSQDVLIKSGM